MTNKRPPESYEEVLHRILEAFEHVDFNSEEIDMLLTEFGYNPEQIAAYFEEFAKEALNKSSLNWRNRAQKEVDEARAEFERSESTENKDRTKLIETIKELLNQIGPKQSRLVTSHFRNFEEATEDDLASLLQELRFLSRNSAQESKDSDN